MMAVHDYWRPRSNASMAAVVADGENDICAVSIRCYFLCFLARVDKHNMSRLIPLGLSSGVIVQVICICCVASFTSLYSSLSHNLCKC